MTPAEELLAAADRLDKLIAAAQPGPWWADLTEIYGDDEMPINRVGETLQVENHERGCANAAYIVAMNPLVGRALAAHLRNAAELYVQIPTSLLDLARAILGTSDARP